MSYQRLTEISNDLILESKDYSFVRQALFAALEPPKKIAVVLKGARGVGKSTLMQQFLCSKKTNGEAVFYVSADSTLITVKLAELAHEYYRRGGQYLAIDEIHKYPGWQAEVKTILDSFSNIKLIVSGSSSLNLDYAMADLSRRHIMVQAKGLSFREYLSKTYQVDFKIYSLQEILHDATEIAFHISRSFSKTKQDLLEIFREYLRSGYFPSKDLYLTESTYYAGLINTINSVIDSDLPSVHKDIDNISKDNIKRLLKHIATKCPFTPNISELSNYLGIANDNILKKYLFYLHESEVLINLYSSNKSHKDFQKPQKIFLNNANFSCAFSDEPVTGTVRETFVANCLVGQGVLTAPTFGDFCLDGKWVFEVGGKSKSNKQIKSITDSYVLADNILAAENNKIPMWLLGFLW